MDAAGQESFREFVANRSSALLKTAVLLSGGDRHAAEDLLQNALIKAAGRWQPDRRARGVRTADPLPAAGQPLAAEVAAPGAERRRAAGERRAAPTRRPRPSCGS